MKCKFWSFLLGLFLCLMLVSTAFAAEENTVTVTVSELTPGYYVGAVWDGDTLLTLFDAEVGSDGILNETVDIGDTPLSGDTVQVGISSANAGGKPIAPVVCPINSQPTKPTDPTKPTEPLYFIYIPNIAGGIVTAPTQTSYAGSYIPLTVSPNRGYELRNIYLTDGAGNRVPVSYSGGQYWFLMPSSSVTVYAGFVPIVSNSNTTTTSTSTPVTSTTKPRPEYSTQSPLALTVFASKTGSIKRVSYSIDFALSAGVTGGTDCSYQFTIKQNGKLTRSTGWTSNSVFSGFISGSGTCVAEISVKDSSGRTTTATLDLLGKSCSAFSSSSGSVTPSSPISPSNPNSGSATTPEPNQTPSPNNGPLTIGISNSAIKSIAGSRYDIRLNLVAHATGGDGSYSYKFVVLQNGEVTKSTDWSSNNAISGDLRGVGTCVVEIYARDSAGEMATVTVDLLE